jgi:hypothetical protein
LIGLHIEHNFLTWNHTPAFVLLSGRVEIDSTGPSRPSFAALPSTGLVDVCTKTSPGNRKKSNKTDSPVYTAPMAERALRKQ